MSNPQRVGINTNVKQFNTSNALNSALWVFSKAQSTITPGNKGVNALIQGDLTVEGTLYTPSDLLVKENVETISDELCDKVLDIKPIKFNYIYDDNKKEHYGVIAQELEKIFPELVSEVKNNTKNETIKTVNYIELIPIMLGKMSKMQTEIDNLKLLLHI